MKNLSLVRDDEVVSTMPLPIGWNEEDVMDVDDWLRANNIIDDETEICVTEDMP